jgi:hypothetical protein
VLPHPAPLANPRAPQAEPAAAARAQTEHIGNFKRRTVRQRAEDFAAGTGYYFIPGENSLRLATDAPVRPETGQAEALYISPVRQIATPEQQQEEAFDSIQFDYHVAASARDLVVFEYRTVAVDEEGEGWSEWTEVPPESRRRPIHLDRTAEKWQYRVLLAQAPGGNAEIRDIQIVTHQDTVKARHQFNYGSP